MRDILTVNEIDPHDLSIISQTNCPKPNSDSHVIDIDDETLSAKTAGSVIRGTGNAIANGAEFAVEGVGTIIEKVKSDKPEK